MIVHNIVWGMYILYVFDYFSYTDHSSTGMSESDFELAEEEGKPQDIPKVEETVYVCNEVEELGQVSL